MQPPQRDSGRRVGGDWRVGKVPNTATVLAFTRFIGRASHPLNTFLQRSFHLPLSVITDWWSLTGSHPPWTSPPFGTAFPDPSVAGRGPCGPPGPWWGISGGLVPGDIRWRSCGSPGRRFPGNLMRAVPLGPSGSQPLGHIRLEIAS